MLLHLFIYSFSAWAHALWHRYAVQRTTYMRRLCPSTMWVPGTELRSLAWWQAPLPDDEPSHRPFPLSLPALHPLLVTLALIRISNFLKRLFLYSETVSAYMLKHTCRALLNNQDNGKSKVPFTVTSGWKEVEKVLLSRVAGHRLWRTWLLTD